MVAGLRDETSKLPVHEDAMGFARTHEFAFAS